MTEPLPPEDTDMPVPDSGPLLNSLTQFTGCIGNALDGVCSFGLIMGDNYVPFDPDEDEDCDSDEGEGPDCTQAWVRVMDIGVKSFAPGSGFDGNPDRVFGTTKTISLEVGVLRCISLPEEGKAFSTTDMLEGAVQSIEDMDAILCAAMNCRDEDGEDLWTEITVGRWAPMGPLGGQYGGTWTFTVEL